MSKFMLLFVLGLSAVCSTAMAQERCRPQVTSCDDGGRACCYVSEPIPDNPSSCRRRAVCGVDEATARAAADQAVEMARAQAQTRQAEARLAVLTAQCRPESCADFVLPDGSRLTREECEGRAVVGRYNPATEQCNVCDSPFFRQQRQAVQLVVKARERPHPAPAPRRVVITPPREFTLTIVKAGDGDGVIDPIEGDHQYRQGTRVQILASPNDGSTFDGWSGDRDCENGQVRMTGNRRCIATFTLIPPPPPPPEPPPPEPPPEPIPPPEPPPVPHDPCEVVGACLRPMADQIDAADRRVRRTGRMTRETLRRADRALHLPRPFWFELHSGVFTIQSERSSQTAATGGVLANFGSRRLSLYGELIFGQAGGEVDQAVITGGGLQYRIGKDHRVLAGLDLVIQGPRFALSDSWTHAFGFAAGYDWSVAELSLRTEVVLGVRTVLAPPILASHGWTGAAGIILGLRVKP